jgi:general stress protein CsbA
MSTADWILAVVVVALWNGYLVRQMNKEKLKRDEMDTKSKFNYFSTLKAIAPHYLKLLKRGFSFVFCVITFPVFLLLRGIVFLYRLIRK